MNDVHIADFNLDQYEEVSARVPPTPLNSSTYSMSLLQTTSGPSPNPRNTNISLDLRTTSLTPRSIRHRTRSSPTPAPRKPKPEKYRSSLGSRPAPLSCISETLSEGTLQQVPWNGRAQFYSTSSVLRVESDGEVLQATEPRPEQDPKNTKSLVQHTSMPQNIHDYPTPPRKGVTPEIDDSQLLSTSTVVSENHGTTTASLSPLGDFRCEASVDAMLQKRSSLRTMMTPINTLGDLSVLSQETSVSDSGQGPLNPAETALTPISGQGPESSYGDIGMQRDDITGGAEDLDATEGSQNKSSEAGNNHTNPYRILYSLICKDVENPKNALIRYSWKPFDGLKTPVDINIDFQELAVISIEDRIEGTPLIFRRNQAWYNFGTVEDKDPGPFVVGTDFFPFRDGTQDCGFIPNT